MLNGVRLGSGSIDTSNAPVVPLAVKPIPVTALLGVAICVYRCADGGSGLDPYSWDPEALCIGQAPAVLPQLATVIRDLCGMPLKCSAVFVLIPAKLATIRLLTWKIIVVVRLLLGPPGCVSVEGVVISEVISVRVRAVIRLRMASWV